MVVFVVKRYAVREAIKWRYAVRKAKKGPHEIDCHRYLLKLLHLCVLYCANLFSLVKI